MFFGTSFTGTVLETLSSLESALKMEPGKGFPGRLKAIRVKVGLE
jgi:hypothetical protein